MTGPTGAAGQAGAAEPGTPMGVDEVRRRATGGAVVVVLRNLLIRLLTLGGTLVLARLLSPRDFGIVAIGLTLLMVAGVVAEAGMGAALIRRSEPPSKEDLQSVLGFQLAVTLPLAAAIAAVALPFGELGTVTAVMMTALPVLAFRTPGAILLEREMLYHRLMRVEYYETVVQYGGAIVAVALGMGVWGLASASIARAGAGALMMTLASPCRVVRPRLDWARMRPILGFGARFQAVGIVSMVRDQGLNAGTAAIAGVAVLGLWSLAFRVLQLPFLLFHALWRVSYPGMARLMEAGEAPGPTVERGISLVAVVTGGVLVALVGSGPAMIPALFGERWQEVAEVLPWACLGLMISSPVGVASVGYLYASGDASTVLRSVMVHTVVWIAVAFALLPSMGVVALGVGWLASGVADLAVLGPAVARRLDIRPIAPIVVPTAVAAAAAAAGWLAASSGEATVLLAVAGGLLAEVLYLAGMLVFRRSTLRDAVGAVRRGISASLARA